MGGGRRGDTAEGGGGGGRAGGDGRAGGGRGRAGGGRRGEGGGGRAAVVGGGGRRGGGDLAGEVPGGGDATDEGHVVYCTDTAGTRGVVVLGVPEKGDGIAATVEVLKPTPTPMERVLSDTKELETVKSGACPEYLTMRGPPQA